MSHDKEENKDTVGVGRSLVSMFKAKEAVDNGGMVKRKHWGTGHFIFQQVPSIVGSENFERMSSLPQQVKNELVRRLENAEEHSLVVGCDKAELESVSYCDQIARVYPNNKIVSWSPSISDLNATDWIIL